MTRGWTPTTELAQNMQFVEGAGLRARHVPESREGLWEAKPRAPSVQLDAGGGTRTPAPRIMIPD
jgi:hypothetical protein